MYIPKSKIETNLYSNGEFVVESTNTVYYGSYFKTFDGIFYSGKEPNDGPNFILLPFQETLNSSEEIVDYRFNEQNITYSTLTNQPKEYNPILPIPFVPQPVEADYETGEFTRYFAKKRNENVYYEVSDESLLENPLYFIFNLQWVISGEESYVKATNQRMVTLYMEQLPIPAFNKFLKNDYLKFWKPS